LKDSRLVIFATSLFLFQLANASVLPLAGEALVRMSQMNSSLIISALIIVPQVLVALMAPWVGRQAQSWGRRPLLLIGFAALPIRALGFALISDPLLLLAIQALDGISGAVLGGRIFVYCRHRVARDTRVWFLMPETKPPIERTETDGQSVGHAYVKRNRFPNGAQYGVQDSSRSTADLNPPGSDDTD
jgi:MFS family permease